MAQKSPINGSVLFTGPTYEQYYLLFPLYLNMSFIGMASAKDGHYYILANNTFLHNV